VEDGEVKLMSCDGEVYAKKMVSGRNLEAWGFVGCYGYASEGGGDERFSREGPYLKNKRGVVGALGIYSFSL